MVENTIRVLSTIALMLGVMVFLIVSVYLSYILVPLLIVTVIGSTFYLSSKHL